MRHGKKFNHLSRTTPHRKALLANMACSLIDHKKISTTVAKAKALQKYVEPLITKSKTDSTHSRRIVFSYLKSKQSVAELFRDIAPKITERPGGYTRILKTGFRLGDNAQMCLIELVDYNDNMLKETKTKKTTRRRGSGAGKTGGTTKATTAAVETKAETTTEEVKDSAVVETPEKTAKEVAPKTEEKEVKKESTPKTEKPKEEKVEAKKEESKKEEKKEETPKASTDDKEKDSKEEDKKD